MIPDRFSVIEAQPHPHSRQINLRDLIAAGAPPAPAAWTGYPEPTTDDIYNWPWHYADEVLKRRETSKKN